VVVIPSIRLSAQRQGLFSRSAGQSEIYFPSAEFLRTDVCSCSLRCHETSIHDLSHYAAEKVPSAVCAMPWYLVGWPDEEMSQL